MRACWQGGAYLDAKVAWLALRSAQPLTAAMASAWTHHDGMQGSGGERRVGRRCQGRRCRAAELVDSLAFLLPLLQAEERLEGVHSGTAAGL